MVTPEQIEPETSGDTSVPEAKLTTVAKALPNPSIPVVPEGTDLEEEAAWKNQGVLPPPMDPYRSWTTYTKSAELPKNVLAMARNTSGFGFDLEPVVKLDGKKAIEEVGMAIYLDRVSRYQRAMAAVMMSPSARRKGMDKEIPLPLEPTEEEVQTELEHYKKRARLEKAQLEIYFENLCYEYPFEELLNRTDMNRGEFGFCGWQIIRDPFTGMPIRAQLVEALHLRHTIPDKVPVPVPHFRRISKIHYEEVRVERRFRRLLVRNHVGQMIWFKQFGDPRVMSDKTGLLYPDIKTFEAAQKGLNPMAHEFITAKPANEILFFDEYAAGSNGYGLPPWHGAAPGVQATRLAWELIVDDLANGKIPRGLLSIVDGEVGDEVAEALKEFFREGGKNNRNRLAILRFFTAKMQQVAGAGRASAEFTDLSGSQNLDAIHPNMRADVENLVGESFGNPPILRGATKDVQNKAVSTDARKVAEELRYVPRRRQWEYLINQAFVRPLGIKFWRFKLKAPRQIDVKEWGMPLAKLVEQNVLRPEEARMAAGEMFGLNLEPDAHPSQEVSVKLTIAGVGGQEEEPTPAPEEDEPTETVLEDEAQRVLASFGKLIESPELMQKALRVSKYRELLDRVAEQIEDEDVVDLGVEFADS